MVVMGSFAMSASIIFKTDKGKSYEFPGTDVFTPLHKAVFPLNGDIVGV